jgi:hypothetical protein
MTNHRKNGDFKVGNKARQIGDEPATHVLTVRATRETKGRWVLASRKAPGRGLSEWVTAKLNAAADAELGESKT